ncbi:MAG: PBP1A family penicillin-binding protein [Myxococcota bacterium]
MAARKRLRPRKAKKKRRRPRSRLWRWVRRLGILTLVGGILGVVGLAGIFWYYGRDLPDVATLRAYAPPQTTRVVDRHGELIGEIFSERRTVVPMDQIPRNLVLCVLAAEDADFYQHEGLDYPGIIRAVLRDVLEGRAAQGASTITQQVVKLLLLSPERTLSRKIRELILARRLEQELTKDEILHLYLNHINFGHGRHGVQEAASFYFGKDVSELSLAEASLIAGIPQAPARLSPRTHLEAAQRRQRFVLGQLAAKREEYWPDLSLEAIDEARDTEVPLVERATRPDRAPEIMRIARQTLREQVGDEAFRRGGYTVHTTLDLRLQAAARQAVRSGLETVDRRQRYVGPLRVRRQRRRPPTVENLREGRIYVGEVTAVDDSEGSIVLDVGGHRVTTDLSDAARYNPDEISASEFAPVGARAHVSILGDGSEGRLELGPQGAAIVIEPRTRDVLALVGGYDASPGFNRALQARRQPGSTFKPIVYALGVHERRLSPATVLIDAPVVYNQWQPQNYEPWRHEGSVRLRVALAESINTVAVRALTMLGPDSEAEAARLPIATVCQRSGQAAVSFAQELGIASDLDPGCPLALGASAVRPVELTNAYATFAAGGRWTKPRFIARIEDPNGEAIDLPSEPVRDVMSAAEAYVVTDMLTSVTQAGGTASRASRLGKPAAGKTGTSNRVLDAWFVGYTPNIVAGVWVGFDDRRSLGRREAGGRSALPIWLEIVRAAEQGRPEIEFPRPSGIVEARIDPASGLLAYEGQEDAITEVFLEDAVPEETARPPEIADPSTFLMEQLGGSGQVDAGVEASP